MTTLSDTTPSILPPTAAQPAKKRLPYIDTAKGILMICLLYGHMHIYAEMVGYHNEGMKLMQQLVPLYASFFMQTFFVITGYCSTFRIGLKPYVWKNAKTLILPAVVLGIVGSVCDLPFDGVKPPEELLTGLRSWLVDKGPWFVFALFWAKLAYWFVGKLRGVPQILILATLYLAGIALERYTDYPNYLYHRHAMVMLPYLALGAWLKDKAPRVERYLGPAALFFVLSISLQWVLWINHLSFIPIQDYYISLSLKSFPLHIVNALSGTAFGIYIAKHVGNHRLLLTMGYGSLFVYLFDEPVQKGAAQIVLGSGISGSTATMLLADLAAWIVSAVIFYLLIKIVYRNKWLSWMVGKW